MKNRMMVNLAASILVAFLVQSAAGAQSSRATGTLHAVVTDPSGAVIPGASVTVSGDHFVQAISTDETGPYTVAGLLPGHYRVQIHAAGFSGFEKSGLVLSAGHETEAGAQLTISTSRQEITVTAGPTVTPEKTNRE